MLRLIIGTAGTGKSTLVKEQIQQNARNGIKSVLIVPEQFSKTGEAEIFSALEKSQLGLVEVYSFTSLLRDVWEQSGKPQVAMLSDAGKAVIIRKSLQNVYKQLNSYDNQKNNIGFAYNLARTFEDFKRNGIDGETLYQLAQKAPDINRKLKDIAIIYSEYCAHINAGGTDLEQLYLQLAQTLPVSYTDGRQYFIDGFESFTSGQYAVISTLMERAADVCVALTADGVSDIWNGTHPLSYTAQTAAKLIAAAKKAGVQVAPPQKLKTQHRFKNQTLCNVDNTLLSVPVQKTDEENNAFVTEFSNQYTEVSFAVAKIAQLVREGYKYSDIAVVCPQLEKYEHQLQESFGLAQLPFFIDQNRIILSSAPVQLFRNIMEIMDRGLAAGTVIPLLKTQLTHYESETISCLENYLFVWQGQKLDWQKEFTLPYGGYTDPYNPENEKILEDINIMIKSLSEIFGSNKTGEYRPAAEILSDMYSVVEKLDCEQILADLISNTQDREKAELYIRQWKCAVDCLQQLYTICGDMSMRPREVCELFMLMMQGTEIGFAPQTQDCIIISTPQRMKIDAVKVVFVLGAAQDIFPSAVSENGILSNVDLKYLKENQVEIGVDIAKRFAFENLYFYKALTTAREKLFVSCAKKNVDSTEMLSAEMEKIKNVLGLEAATLTTEDYAITPQFFTQYIGEKMGTEGKTVLDMLDIPAPQVKQREFELHNKDYVKQIYGNNLITSPTSLEGYNRCPFSYLVKNLLKIYPLEKATVSQREAGNYLHAIAQQVLEKYGEKYGQTPWDEIEQYILQVVQEYVQQNFPEPTRQSNRFAVMSENMKENALQLLKYIYTEQQNGKFRPVAFEKKIGFGPEDIGPVTLNLQGGEKVTIIGTCDRIDVMHREEGEYIRIVDYKTGSKKFSKKEVANGISSQLLLYMDSVLKSNEFGDNPLPGAVMYQPSDIEYTTDGKKPMYMPTGIALENFNVAYGFDDEAKGRFGIIKVTSNKDEYKVEKCAGEGAVVDMDKFARIIEYVNTNVTETAQNIYDGVFPNQPLEKGRNSYCDSCSYRAICREFGNERKMKDATIF